MLNEGLHPKNKKRLQQEFENQRTFYNLQFLKLKSGVHRSPVKLRHRKHQVLQVDEFMDLYIIHEIFVQACYDVWPERPKNPVIIDVGANKGFFALRMQQLFPDMRLHCIEPVEHNLDRLRAHITDNKIPAKVHPFAIGFPERTDTIYLHPTNSGGHSLVLKNKGGEQEVKVISLRNFMALNDIDHCHMLKLDCEGAEKEIILSIDEELAKRVDAILFESATTELFSPQLLLDHLKGLGYVAKAHEDLFIAYKPKQKN